MEKKYILTIITLFCTIYSTNNHASEIGCSTNHDISKLEFILYPYERAFTKNNITNLKNFEDEFQNLIQNYYTDSTLTVTDRKEYLIQILQEVIANYDTNLELKEYFERNIDVNNSKTSLLTRLSFFCVTNQSTLPYNQNLNNLLNENLKNCFSNTNPNISYVNWLLNAGANANIKVQNNISILQIAMNNGNDQLVKTLKNHGAYLRGNDRHARLLKRLFRNT